MEIAALKIDSFTEIKEELDGIYHCLQTSYKIKCWIFVCFLIQSSYKKQNI